MRIAGLQKLSLVDYPGHLAAVVFVQGCNFRCGYCHNPDLITFQGRCGEDEEAVLRDLARRRNMIEGVVLSGGEPTAHPDLPGFISRIKELGFLVKLDTNGSNPALVLEMLRARLLDYVAMDIKTSLGRYDLVTDIGGIADAVSESIRWIMLATASYEFRTTCVPGIVGEEDFRLIAGLVKGARRYCLQQFNPSITLDSAMRGVKPYDSSDISRFCGILKEQVSVVDVRGL